MKINASSIKVGDIIQDREYRVKVIHVETHGPEYNAPPIEIMVNPERSQQIWWLGFQPKDKVERIKKAKVTV